MQMNMFVATYVDDMHYFVYVCNIAIRYLSICMRTESESCKSYIPGIQLYVHVYAQYPLPICYTNTESDRGFEC